MPIADLNHFKMNYDVVENVVPHDTLFIHGNTGSNRWWLPALQSLRTRSSSQASGNRASHQTNPMKGRAIFAEWRGCGSSGAPADASQLQPEVLGADYVALLEHLGVTSASVVGHSLGGLISLYAVASKPSLFKKIFLLNSVGPKGIPYDDSAYDYFERIPTSRATCAHALSFSFHDQHVDATLFDRLVDDAMKMSPVNWTSIWRMLGRFDASKIMSEINLPTLIVHGEKDRVLPLQDAYSLKAALPHARLITLKNQGHSPNIEDPEHFTSLLSSFLYEGETLH